MDGTACVLLEGQALHHQVAAGLWLLAFNQLVGTVVYPEQVGVSMLAYLAGKLLPEESREVFCLADLLLDLEPLA